MTQNILNACEKVRIKILIYINVDLKASFSNVLKFVIYLWIPGIICSRGRSREQYLQDGTGTGLYLQNGSNPIEDSREVPLYEKDVEGAGWVKGQCFTSMGNGFSDICYEILL